MYREKFYLDSRVIKTTKALKNAMISLLKFNSYAEIDVTRLSHEAKVTRGSFYNHFSSKEVLLDALLYEKLKDLENAYREPFLNNRPFILSRLSYSEVRLFNNVFKNADFYTTILNSDIAQLFENQMFESLKNINTYEVNVRDSIVKSDLIASYMAYGVVGLITQWVREGYKYEAEFMNAQLLELMRIPPQKTFHIRLQK